MAFLVEDLIESVKDRSFAPISQSTFQDADILRILNEELSLKLVADLLTVREDFFLALYERAIVADKDHYLIPPKAIGGKINALFIVDSNDNRAILERWDVVRSSEYNGSRGGPEKFYFEADEVVIMPKPSAAGDTLLFSYPREPNELVLTSSCAKITSVSSNSTHTTFTVDTDLTGSLSVGDDVDFLRGVSPFTLWAEEKEITAITSTTIQVLKSDVVDVDGTVEPGANDYICPTGYANIAMIPKQFHPVLAQMGAVRVLAALGDQGKWQSAKAELEQMRTEALKLVRQRADGTPEVMNGNSPLLSIFRGF